MPLPIDRAAAERWENQLYARRGDYAPRAKRGTYGRDDWHALTPEQRSLAKIDWCKRAILRDRYNVVLKKRLKRQEALHAQRTLLGWAWLEEHPEHELSPGHEAWLKYGPKQQL